MAVEHGGKLEVGGLDGDPVRRDVVQNCVRNGWLKFDAGAAVHSWVGCFRITDAGRAAISSAEGKE